MILYIDASDNVVDVEKFKPSVLKYETIIAKNGDDTIYEVQHNLNSTDVWITINDGSTQILVDWMVINSNKIKLEFHSPLLSSDIYYLIVYAKKIGGDG